MARLDPMTVSSVDTQYLDLSRLLDRLQYTILAPYTDKNLYTSSHERAKVGANLEYARTLFLGIEHEISQDPKLSGGFRGSAARRDELKQKKVLLRKLQHRLHELEQHDDETETGNSQEEDILATYGLTDSSVLKSVPTASSSGNGLSSGKLGTAEPTSTLRSRAPQPTAISEDTATTTSSDRLFASGPASKTSSNTADALLSHHTSEQEALTDSLLSLATQLKESTLSFSDTLAAGNPIVDRATQALDKTIGGMSAAEKRMGMLRRMTEGRGWLGRLSLYGWIGVLWAVLVMIFVVLPKFRL